MYVIKVSLLLIFAVMVAAIGTADAESPREQLERGVQPEDVICREAFELVIRNSGDPACVRPGTAERMLEAGIAHVPVRAPPPEARQAQDARIPAGASTVNFYITDDDLNLAPNAAETVLTDGLLVVTINGIEIDGPDTMTETGPDTGRFYVKVVLPESVGGMQIGQDDIVLIRYLDESDGSGNPQTVTKSVPLAKSLAKVQASGGSRIGHEFVLRLYEPDANRDSRDVDKIPLGSLEFRSEGGIRASLASPEFDANSRYLLETGPNTGVFEVEIEIPRQIGGKTVHIGDEYEIRYIDRSTPSETDERVVLKKRIG